MEPIDVAKLIGGKVLANFQGNPAFVNGCTVRLSYALNMCGGSHKIPFSYEKTISGDADRNNQKEWYYYKVADIIPYLDGKYGTHQTVTLEDIKGKTGIIGQTKCEGWGLEAMWIFGMEQILYHQTIHTTNVKIYIFGISNKRKT